MTTIEKIKEWLDTPGDQRDIEAGALLLLQVNKNRIFFANVIRNPKAKAESLAYQLQKVYNTRVIDATKEEVAEMMTKVNAIAKRLEPKSEKSDFQKGKRADHDELPAEVQQLWTDNLAIRSRMAECHLRMRLVSEQNSSCPDNDRYPFAKEIIELDKKYRRNFALYDNYSQGSTLEQTMPAVDERTAQLNYAKTINLLKSNYAKTQNEKLGEKIKKLYAKLTTPSEKLTAELQELGLIS